MRHLITKAEKRESLSDAIDQFFKNGGKVDEVQQGISGRENPTQAILPVLFGEKSMERTDARGALKSIDDRKQKALAKKATVKKDKKIPVYDDFGEILRWVWESGKQ
ncbi:MAG: hypothetical protein ACJAYK_003028 [Crocinitomicaceae bacterium]